MILVVLSMVGNSNGINRNMDGRYVLCQIVEGRLDGRQRTGVREVRFNKVV